jgi:DNA-binding NarL/FixJ family response regulator
LVNYGCGLTAREREILRLSARGLTDYRIARKLRVEAPNITRSRVNALRKIEKAQGDLAFLDSLGLKVWYQT